MLYLDRLAEIHQQELRAEAAQNRLARAVRHDDTSDERGPVAEIRRSLLAPAFDLITRIQRALTPARDARSEG